MSLKQFTDSWWFWGMVVSASLFRGYLFHWDWITWFILCYMAMTAVMRIVACRRKQKEAMARTEVQKS
jgi:hypothetical protein